MTHPEKIFDTGLRILNVLKILFQEDASKNELINKIKNNSNFENVYTQEAFIKYFNTFELLGFKFEKSKNVYKLKNSLSDLNLTEEEVSVFIDVIRYINKLHNKNLEDSLKKVLFNVVKYIESENQLKLIDALNEENNKIVKSNSLINSLENLFYEHQLVSITYKKSNDNIETITVEIKDIVEKKDGIVVFCYDPKSTKNKKINTDTIIAVKRLPTKAQNSQYPNSVVFRLYGRLAGIYKLKESEMSLDCSDEYITVSNYEEDHDNLLRRLLKYGENCVIIRPSSMRKEIINLSNEIIKNLSKDTSK